MFRAIYNKSDYTQVYIGFLQLNTEISRVKLPLEIYVLKQQSYKRIKVSNILSFSEERMKRQNEKYRRINFLPTDF